MVNAGPASWVLGMRVTNGPSSGRITLDQTQYTLKVVEKFGMANCKPAATPLPEKTVLHAATDEEAHDACSYPYLQVIGSVMYAMLGTRPDITYAVSTLSRFASRPGTPHVRALKHLLQYLKGSAHYGIIYSHDGGSLMGCLKDNIYGFTDSDYAMDPDTHRSVSGAVFLLAGVPISWSSRLQSSVSQSSTEAEYVASTEAAKEAVWLRRLMHDLKQDISLPTTLFIDNHIRECVANGSIILRSVASADNVADICTKPLGKVKFSLLRSILGVVCLDKCSN